MFKSVVLIGEFRVNIAEFVDRVMCGKGVVFIKKYDRTVAVLMSLDNYERLLDPTMHLSKAKWNKEVQILDDVKRKILKTDPGILEKEINRELKHTKKKHYKMIKREEVKGEIVLFINFPGCICY